MRQPLGLGLLAADAGCRTTLRRVFGRGWSCGGLWCAHRGAATWFWVLVALIGTLTPACLGRDDAQDLAYFRAQNAMLAGRYDWARVYFAEDHRRNPERLESVRGEGLAWLAGRGGSVGNGVDRLQRYLQSCPDDFEIVHRLVTVLLNSGDFEGARRWSRNLDESPQSLLLRAKAELDIDPALALDLATRAVERDEDLPDAHLVIAVALERLGNPEQAAAAARRAIVLDPIRSDVYAQLARLCHRAGDEAGAHEVLAVYDVLRPLAGGRSLESSEELQILEQLEQMTNADGFRLSKRRARLLLETGRIDEGVAALQVVMNEVMFDTADRLFFARLLYSVGERNLARDFYLAVLRNDPDNVTACTSLALLEYGDGNVDHARELLELALEDNQQVAPYHATLAEIDLAEGRVESAAEQFRHALRLAPWEHTWRLSLADILRARGETEAVAELLDGAIEAHPAIEVYRRRNIGP